MTLEILSDGRWCQVLQTEAISGACVVGRNGVHDSWLTVWFIDHRGRVQKRDILPGSDTRLRPQPPRPTYAADFGCAVADPVACTQ